MGFSTFDRMLREERKARSRMRVYVAAAGLLLAAWSFYMQYWFGTHGSRARGEVVAIERVRPSSHEHRFADEIFVRYRHPSGNDVTFSQYMAPFFFSDLRQGDRVPVLYSPYRPSDATIAHGSRWGWSVIFFALAMLALTSGFWGRLVPAKSVIFLALAMLAPGFWRRLMPVKKDEPRNDDEPTVLKL